MAKPSGNSIIALGYILGCSTNGDHPMYKVVEADAPNAQATIEHSVTGNQYRVSIEQISGEE